MFRNNGQAYFHSKSCPLFLPASSQHLSNVSLLGLERAAGYCQDLSLALWTCSGIPLTAAYWLFFSFIYRKILDFNDSQPQISDQPLEQHTFGQSGKIRTQLWLVLPKPQEGGITADSSDERDETFETMCARPIGHSVQYMLGKGSTMDLHSPPLIIF